MPGRAALLACDWGTTNLRAWTLDRDGRVLADRDFELGVSRLKPGEAAACFQEQVRPALQAVDAPAILCGMVGSNLGWTVAPYVDCPATFEDLADHLVAVEAHGHPVRIVPGLKGPGLAGGCDVMRGEETQLLGWVAEDPARARGRHVVCHPGTHAKWALIEDGRIVRFATAMTGELFAVLRKHSVLRSEAEPDDEAAFDQGLAAAGDGGALAARLFTARARVVGGGAPAESTPSYLSGLLIGAEAAAMPGLLCDGPPGPVALLGDPQLCRWYARALQAGGIEVAVHDGEAAAVRGLSALARLGGLL
jgi:2-dehydro-3-deoxygalactonokinase